jgi:hypothetical protein
MRVATEYEKNDPRFPLIDSCYRHGKLDATDVACGVVIVLGIWALSRFAIEHGAAAFAVIDGV